jgi:hypothetical protein
VPSGSWISFESSYHDRISGRSRLASRPSQCRRSPRPRMAQRSGRGDPRAVIGHCDLEPVEMAWMVWSGRRPPAPPRGVRWNGWAVPDSALA